jgi:hypothetical protein
LWQKRRKSKRKKHEKRGIFFRKVLDKESGKVVISKNLRVLKTHKGEFAA